MRNFFAIFIFLFYMSSVSAEIIPYKQIQMGTCVSQPSTGCDIYQFNHGAVEPITYDTDSEVFKWGDQQDPQNIFLFQENQINGIKSAP